MNEAKTPQPNHAVNVITTHREITFDYVEIRYTRLHYTLVDVNVCQ